MDSEIALKSALAKLKSGEINILEYGEIKKVIDKVLKEEEEIEKALKAEEEMMKSYEPTSQKELRKTQKVLSKSENEKWRRRTEKDIFENALLSSRNETILKKK